MSNLKFLFNHEHDCLKFPTPVHGSSYWSRIVRKDIKEINYISRVQIIIYPIENGNSSTSLGKITVFIPNYVEFQLEKKSICEQKAPRISVQKRQMVS